MDIYREINRPNPSKLFLDAFQVTGMHLQKEFSKHNRDLTETQQFKWIKAELTSPAFDHLSFSFGNQVFSVLIDLWKDGSSQLTEIQRKQFLKATSENNLIPCRFIISLPSLKPANDGWNLTHFTTGNSVIPNEIISDESVEMSEWELRNFAIQVVKGHIQQEGVGKIESYSDVLGVDPQLWFKDAKGKVCWVVVRHFKDLDKMELSDFVGLEKQNPTLKNYDGYLAGVSSVSAAPALYDLEGNLIPLSERYSGTAPLYRGDPFHVRYEGLQRIYVA